MVDNIIRLFEDNDSDYSTHGLGVIQDAVSCEVNEELNGQFELTMEYPVDGALYNELRLRRQILTKPNPYDGFQSFRIYSIETPINGTITVHAQHISYDLSDYILDPTISPDDIIEANTLDEHMAVFNTYSIPKVTDKFSFYKEDGILPVDEDEKFEYESRTKISNPISAREFLGNNILGDFKADVLFNNYSVSLLRDRGEDNGVIIAYGKNLIDFNQEANNAEMVTKVYPYYSSGDVLVTLMTDPEYGYENNLITIVDADYVKIGSLDLSSEFSEVPSSKELYDAALKYVEKHKLNEPKITITISFLDLARIDEYKDLANLETVKLGDTVNILFEKFKITSKSRVISYSYNCILDKYISINLGEKESNLADTMVKITADAVTRSEVIEISKTATELITGNKGGYVVLHDTDDDGKPDEILVMDTENPETATKVWRFNKAGLGYSGTGYDGPYGLAMTMDGAINCDFLKAGIITGREINNGNGTFHVSTDGTVISNKLISNNATITGGSINIVSGDKENQIIMLSSNGASVVVSPSFVNISDGKHYTNILGELIEVGNSNTNKHIIINPDVGIYDGDNWLHNKYATIASLNTLSESLNNLSTRLTTAEASIIGLDSTVTSVATELAKVKTTADNAKAVIDNHVSSTSAHRAADISTTFQGQGNVYNALAYLYNMVK